MLQHTFPYFRDASRGESNIWTSSLFCSTPLPPYRCKSTKYKFPNYSMV